MRDFDSLTGIGHRTTFFASLVSAITHARTSGAPLALCYIDIDHMKHFNMHNGFQAGDTLLQRFVVLVTSLHENQGALFRVGGDKFALILPNSSGAEAASLAHQICVRVRQTLAPPQPAHCGDRDCLGPAKIAVSIGVSIFDDTMDAEGLWQSVEKKVSNAKLAGGDQVWL